MIYFIDYLSLEQDFGYEIPLSGSPFKTRYKLVHIDTGEESTRIIANRYKHLGSFCDVVTIQVSGTILRMFGNPSRWNRVDNLIGFEDIDSCVACFNSILFDLKLPLFTRCTEIFYRQDKDGTKFSKFSNGAIIKRVDITTNKIVGKNCEKTFIKAISQMRYRNMVGDTYTNGCTVYWKNPTTEKVTNLIYPKCYIKHIEMKKNSFSKIKKRFGERSKEFNYLNKVYEYCKDNGVVRFEQSLKSKYLQRENLCFWGISDFSKFYELQQEFTSMYKKLSVTKPEIQDVMEQLISKGVVDSRRQASTTAFYFSRWISGDDMSLIPTATFKRHRARLRKIGIDIANAFDVQNFQAVRVISCESVFVRPFKAPDFYQFPSNIPTNLRLVA